MRTKKSIWILIAVAVLIAAVVMRHYRLLRQVSVEDSPLAVGLRGTNRVSKPMSDRQRDRFETNFLATPAVARPASSSTLPSSVAQAQAINAFNQKQNR